MSTPRRARTYATRILRLSLSGFFLLAAFGGAAVADTFTVTSTNDSGAGSLRQAILDANASFTVQDTIVFAIPGAGVKTIAPVTDLPTVADQVTIDGFSQPGAGPNTLPTGNNAVYLIELRGPGSGGDGLRITGGSVTVKGLVINGWNGSPSSAGVHAVGSQSSVAVTGCFIGTNVTGSQAVPNSVGILAETTHIQIGTTNFSSGTEEAERNVISGNTGDGIRISGSSVISINGCHIGVTASGLQALGNGGDGAELDNTGVSEFGGTTSTVPGLGDGNIIGGNGGAGIRIRGAAAMFNGIYQTKLGTDLGGTIPLGNTGPGVLIEDGATMTTIGGFSETIIAFNSGGGVVVTGSGIGNQVRADAVFGNQGLNIDLGGDGATANDACDADSGPNTLQNRPVLTGITTSIFGELRVAGSLETETGKNYSIQYYTSSSCDPQNPSMMRAVDSGQVNSQASCSNVFDHPLNTLMQSRQPGDDFLVGIAQQDFPTTSGSSEISNCLALPTIVTPGVNLSLQKTAAPDPATEGLPFVYTLTVTNIGATNGAAVKVTDPLPSGTTYLIGDPGCVLKTGTVTCDFGAVFGNGGTGMRRFSVIPSGPGIVTNTATASSSVADDNAADNTDQVMTTVVAAVHDLAASTTGEPFSCVIDPKKQVCTLGQTETFTNNASTWFSGALAITSTCKKPGTPKVSCKIKGTLNVGTFNPLGVPAHTIAAYLSDDDTLDAGDVLVASAPTAVLAAFAPKHKSVKIKYTHPKGQSYTGQFILLKLDSLNAVAEIDEDNNVLILGSFP